MHRNKTEVIIGDRFRKLVVVELVKSTSFSNHYLCKCDCGKEIVLTAGQLNNRIGSCGCRSKPFKVSDVYKVLRSVWRGMIRRCYDTKHKAYHRYGGRGIVVCGEWHDFSIFYSDMYPTYKNGLQLDREDNDNVYNKKNCRWTTRLVNMRNRKGVKLTETDVIAIRASNKTTIELGKMYGVNPGHISRIKNNKVYKL